MAMDEAQTRDHIDRHADAVIRGDMDAIVADFSEELRPGVPHIVQEVLPQPVTAAEVLFFQAQPPRVEPDGPPTEPTQPSAPVKTAKDEAQKSRTIKFMVPDNPTKNVKVKAKLP